LTAGIVRPKDSNFRRISSTIAGSSRLARHVVGRRPQAAADDHEVGGPGQRVQRSDDPLRVVAYDLLADQLHPVELESLGQSKRVGIEAVGSQQLGADGEDASLHPGIIGTDRSADKRAPAAASRPARRVDSAGGRP
jgi:hypothetical protein